MQDTHGSTSSFAVNTGESKKVKTLFSFVVGNQLMKSEKYQEAIQCYTKAMELDSANAVFPCNRFGLKNPFLLFFDFSVFLIVQLSLAHFEGNQ